MKNRREMIFFTDFSSSLTNECLNFVSDGLFLEEDGFFQREEENTPKVNSSILRKGYVDEENDMVAHRSAFRRRVVSA